jgi:hypothetical protein
LKTLIYQYYYSLPVNERTDHIMPDSDRYYEYSEKSMRAYANKCESDYRFINKPHPVSPFYGIFLPFTEGWCHDYDSICWVDADILATTRAKNIFDVASQDCVSAYFMDTHNRWKRDTVFEWWADKGHINSGVVVFPRAVYDPLIEYVKDLKRLHDGRTKLETSLGNFDQAIVNKFVRSQNKYKSLGEEFNYHLTRKPHEKRFDKGLIHYHRKNKIMMPKDFADVRILK